MLGVKDCLAAQARAGSWLRDSNDLLTGADGLSVEQAAVPSSTAGTHRSFQIDICFQLPLGESC